MKFLNKINKKIIIKIPIMFLYEFRCIRVMIYKLSVVRGGHEKPSTCDVG